jgi:hypothetical protein
MFYWEKFEQLVAVWKGGWGAGAQYVGVLWLPGVTVAAGI